VGPSLQRQVRRNFHDAVFCEQCIVGEHAVDAAAECAGVRVGHRLAADPALKKIAGDAVADFDTGDAGPISITSPAVRQRDDVVAHRHAVAAARDAKIAEIERAGFDLDQNLTVAGLGFATLDLRKRLDAGRRPWAIEKHAFSSSCVRAAIMGAR